MVVVALTLISCTDAPPQQSDPEIVTSPLEQCSQGPALEREPVGSIPPPRPDSNDLAKMKVAVVGTDANDARRALAEAGWTVTLVDANQSMTTLTPDARWDRVVIVSCQSEVTDLQFD